MEAARVAGANAMLAERVARRRAEAARTTWPTPKYRGRPVDFFREVLDRELWDEQARWVTAAGVDDARVSVVSGHKTGKSLGEAGLALYFFASFSPVRVFLFAPKIEHIEKIALWKEIRSLYQNSGRCPGCRRKEHSACNHDLGVWACAPQEPCAWCSPLGPLELWNEDSTTGLQSADGRREILAYTARDVDALGGLSGPKMVFIFDEAGGIKPQFFEAMKGNAAGGVTWIMAGNPLHTFGEQYEAHHTKRSLYTHVQEISSKSTPNVREGRKIIPGLATREWVEQRASDWGVDSSAFLIRVEGKYPRYEPGQLLRTDEVAASNERWATMAFKGRLQIGVDVAFTGDDAAIAPRRGYKILEVRAFTGTNPDALADEVAHTARSLREAHEQKPLVTYDAQGKTGRDFGASLRRYEDEIEIVPVYGNGRPRDQRRYLMRRDELAHMFGFWVKRGGALPPDARLEGEIARLVAKPVSQTDQRARVPSNEETRKILGRSPDRRNACELACTDAHAELELAKQHGQTSPPARADRSPPDVGVSEMTPAGPYGAADAGLRRAWGEP
jgi:phage terminase large subunit